MESIKKYVENFRKNHKENRRFSINTSEILSVAQEIRGGSPTSAIITLFSFGYAKGYRAAMAEMKKKTGCRMWKMKFARSRMMCAM